MKSLFYSINPGEADFIRAVIEIPMGSRNKYEYEKSTGAIVLDRVLSSPFFYPVNYGFIPQTWYDDDDPLDIMVYSRYPVVPGCVVESRPIGLLRMKDEKGVDDKLLAVPTADPSFKNVADLTDVPSAVLDEISHFFKRYKDLEKGKYSEVVGWFEKEEAVKAIEKAKAMFVEKYGEVQSD